MKKTRSIQFLCSLLIGIIFMLVIFAGLMIYDRINAGSTDLVFSTNSADAEYDGTPLTNHQWTLLQGGLQEGHQIIATFTGSQTDVGISKNTMTVMIVDENGRDVTDNYAITYEYGTLQINHSTLRLDAATDFEGLTPENGEYILTDDQIDLVSGHYAVVSVSTTTDEVGLPVERIEGVKIYDENHQDVTHNYQIFAQEKGENILIPGEGNGNSDGILPSLDGSAGSSDDNTPMFSVRSSVSGMVYFRTRSCGDYLGDRWDTAPTFPALYEDQYAASYLTSFYLAQRGIPLNQLEIVPYRTDYPLPYYAGIGDGYAIQRNDTVNIGPTDESYVVPFYFYPGDIPYATGNADPFEKAYRKFVYSNYTALDQETLSFMKDIIAEQGFSGRTPQTIKQVASYIQNSATYNKNYDRGLDKATNNAIAFLSQYKEGVCRHFATAATLLYRALGFPARYTVGAVAEVTANTWVEVISKQSHAWVEVYIDGVGWIPVDVTGSGDGSDSGDGVCQDCGDSECDGSCDSVCQDCGDSECDGSCDSVCQDCGDSECDGNCGGDSTEGSILGLPEGYDPNGPPVGQIKTDYSGTVYLYQSSYGDYTGQGWLNADPYSQTLPGGLSCNYLTALALQYYGVDVHQAQFQNMATYMLPYYFGQRGDYPKPSSDTVYQENITEYSLYYYTLPSMDNGVDYLKGYLGRYASYEQSYRAYVHQNYLSIDAVTRQFMQDIIDKEGFSLSDPQVIMKVARYIQNAAIYTLEYDRSMDSADNVVIAFLDQYKEGICQHYASAATLLYRTLGIPARYTVGYVASAEAGAFVDILPKSAHAWVEVYIDGVGWIQVEVTGGAGSEGGHGGAGGNMPGVPKELELTPLTVTKKMDGTPLVSNGLVSGLEVLEQLGYTYYATISGSQLGVGVSESIIESITIYDPRGNDVTGSFEITTHPGRIHVYLYEFACWTVDVTKVYDGRPAYEGLRFWGDQLKENHYLYFDPIADPNVGTKDHSFDVSIKDENGNDFTDYYLITKEYGKLTITPAEITLQANNYTKKYDGKPLTGNSYFIAEGELYWAHTITDVIFSGQQTQIGRSENLIVSLVIVDRAGNDVTANYSIVLRPGTLTVTAS